MIKPVKAALFSLAVLLYLAVVPLSSALGWEADWEDLLLKGLLFLFSLAILLTTAGTGQRLLTWGWILFTLGALNDTVSQFEEFDPFEGYDIVMEQGPTLLGMVFIAGGYLLAIREREKLYRQLQFVNTHDPLTGLYNRTHFDERLRTLMAEGSPLSLIFADMNNLKAVNDTEGHLKGDELIRRTASLLQFVCREPNLIFRWAGDEFVMLLPHTSAEEAGRMIERLQNAMLDTQGDDLPVTAALGSSTYFAQQGPDIYECFSRAEAAMYRNKRQMKSGRDAGEAAPSAAAVQPT